MFTELNRDVPSASTATLTTATLVGVDGSRPPVRSNIEKLTRATLGVTVRAPKRFFIGEERPKYDNTGEETRRLNRRAALVVNLQR